MKRIPLLVVLVTLCPALAWAGPVYGSIFFNGRAVSRAQVTIGCAGAKDIPGNTLDDGSYRIFVPQQGRCVLTISSGNVRASRDAVSSANSVEYNFDVVLNGGGYVLRRR